MPTYRAYHSDPWFEVESNKGRWLVAVESPDPVAYGNPYGQVICWMQESPFDGGSESHKSHSNRMYAMAKRIAHLLNEDERAQEAESATGHLDEVA